MRVPSGVHKSNRVAQYVSCESSAISAGASGNCGRAERSASSKRESNCAVHAGRSERRVCRSSGERSAGGRSRKIATYCVRRSCTPSRHVSMYFFMYRTQASGASNPRFSPSALVNPTLSASRRPIRNARASSCSGDTCIRRRKLTARRRLGSLPGARRVASSWPKSVLMAPFALACTSRTTCTCGKRVASRAACVVRSSASWKCPPRTQTAASMGSSRKSCNFDECSRMRAARQRED
ncbi:hypothetical protein DFH94DRAFT_396048 [Russula ochroleuca]|uniref:Uncharacterized protein n=1 Tax=Russula ochroleuca TaxID=152965 RepID=A0A9P5MQ23_9AGAM|nr:hypothetical protein DFH94DRAFT_396048 [Russula ochroleuca]